jgi:hypothetical protein
MKAPLLAVLLLASTILCQGDVKKDEGQKAQDPQAILKEVLASFKKEGIKLDGKARTVTIPVTVNRPQDAIEYLLIHRKGKKHEAVFKTDTKPSILNAALLMIGLQKGKNAAYVEKDPAPTLEEVQAGADPLVITKPLGQPYFMTVRWTTSENQVEEYCIEDMILDLTTQLPIGACEWIYLGGRMARLYKNDPEVYIADFEGNLISICYLTPDNHLGTMAHERARDDQNWWTTTKLPKTGTEMEFIFHAVEPALHIERMKRIRSASKSKGAAKAKDGGKKDAAKKG